MTGFDQDPAAGIGAFEGPEKTVTLCFRAPKMAVQSLRLISQDTWSAVLTHAKCQILSCVESGSVELLPTSGGKKEKKVVTGKITGYLLSESSLFLSDTTVTLKTCGTTTPLLALEPILDIVVPSWKGRDPSKYLKYMSYGRLGYRFPEQQPDPHRTWTQEVAFLEKYFAGEAVVLGSNETSTYHMFVANYLPRGELLDAISTQVALADLLPEESMVRFVENRTADKTPLKTLWQEMHGSEARSIASEPTLDECFFEPIGYSANGVFANRFTTIHATPQPVSSYVSVETSMPLTSEAKQRFVASTQELCTAGVMSLTEFALCPAFFNAGAPEIPGFTVKDSSQVVSENFACALHHYVRSISS